MVISTYREKSARGNHKPIRPSHHKAAAIFVLVLNIRGNMGIRAQLSSPAMSIGPQHVQSHHTSKAVFALQISRGNNSNTWNKRWIGSYFVVM